MNSLNHRNVFLVNSIVAFALALGLLLGPDSILKMFGLSTGATEKLGAQMIGAALIALGLVTWFAKDFGDSSAVNAISLSFLVSAVCGLVITLLAVSSKVVRTNSWVLIAAYAAFILGYGYLQFFNSAERRM